MFGSDILDIVIGVAFVFLLLSVVCSALNEFFEAIVKNRAKDLERGIRELIGDPQNTTDFVAKLYDHGLVNSLFKGCYSAKSKRNLPSYIPSANFALAVMDLIKNPPPAGIKLPDNLAKAYAIFEQQAAGNAVKLQDSLEDWFNNGMDRVSGWYKRRAQWILVTLGLLVAIVLNADALLIARTLSNDASLRKGLVAVAQARASQPPQVQVPVVLSAAQPAAGTTTNIDPANVQVAVPASVSPRSDADQIDQDIAALDNIGLPIGWTRSKASGIRASGAQASGAPPPNWLVRAAVSTVVAVKVHLIGWLLTAIAVSLGAPFWFDLLGRVIALRATVKPQTDNT